MKAPVRWLDQPDALPDELVAGMQAYADQGPSERERAQMRVGLKLQASAASSVAWKWVALAALIGAGAAWRSWPNAPARTAIPAVPAGAAQPVAAAPEPVAPPLPEVAPAVEPAKVRAAVARPAKRARDVAAAADPSAELALLRRARRALASDPAIALSLTEEHLRDYPAGVFAEERELLAIEALSQRDRPAALARARAFARKYPRSVHQPRIEAALGAR